VISEDATGAWMAYRTPAPELHERVVVRAAALGGALAEQSDLPQGQARQRGRDEEGAGAAADMEQRRGQQRPQ